MSKSPNSIFWPALGVTGIVLGAAYGVSTRGYKAQETQAAQGAERAAISSAEALVKERSALQSDLVVLQSDLGAAQAERDALRSQLAETQLAQTEAETLRATAATLQSELDMARAELAKLTTNAPAAAPVPEAPQPQVSEAAAPPSTSARTGTLTGTLGLGRVAHPAEIAAWDVDVLPDGRGLPPGSGDVLTGEEVFADKCAACHGDFAEGVDNWPVLAGGFDTLGDVDPVKTVGSYWPYLSTVWDYVHRSMPFGEAQSLTADETYAITAYILYSNDIVEDEDFVLSHENFTDVPMYNADGFVVDDRPALEYSLWRAEPCMSDCKDTVEITRRASMVNVTPLDQDMHPAMHGSMNGAASMGADGGEMAQDVAQDLTAAPQDDTAAPAPNDTADNSTPDPALIAAGETVFKKCKACHQVGDGAKNRSGPHLNDLLGRTAGSVEKFRYSKAMADSGLIWDAETLAGFLADPKGYLKGTKMSFRGVKSSEDLAAVIAYLASVSR